MSGRLPAGEKGVIATGFFNHQEAFVKACRAYSGGYNIYAGRNPRPAWFPRICANYLDQRRKQRAKDWDIEYMTAISLDIDPIKPKGTSATDEQHNSAYLWIPFATPVKLNRRNRHAVKEKCRQWQAGVIKTYQPEKHGLKIDGCFDLSRLKKVIGTQSVKGNIHRLSRFVRTGKPDDRVRDAILSLHISSERPMKHIRHSQSLPKSFLRLLKTDRTIQELWLTPEDDTSAHDWKLGCELVKAGIRSEDLAHILRPSLMPILW
jgi:hypothetical protein